MLTAGGRRGRLIHVECWPPGIHQPPSWRISSSGYGVCLLWSWNLRLKSEITAAN
jgi:hypothetical protein